MNLIMTSLLAIIISVLFTVPISLIGGPKRTVRNLRHGEDIIVSVRFMPDGRRLVSASVDGTVVLWDLQTGKSLWKVDLDAGTKTKDSRTISEILDMDVSPDGNTIAVAYDRGRVVGNTLPGKSEYCIGLLHSRDGREFRRLIGHSGLIGTISFSPDGTVLASASSDFTARLWNLQTGKQVWSIKIRGLGKKIVFSPNGEILAIGMLSNSPWQPVVEVRVAQNARLEREIEQGMANVSDIAFSPDGQLLAVATHDPGNSQVELWNLHSTARESSFIHKTDINSIAFSPSGGLLGLGVRSMERERSFFDHYKAREVP